MRIGVSSNAPAAAEIGSALFTAGRDVGGHRVVFIDDGGAVAHASASNLAQFERVLGFTEAVPAGRLVNVYNSGTDAAPTRRSPASSPAPTSSPAPRPAGSTSRPRPWPVRPIRRSALPPRPEP